MSTIKLTASQRKTLDWIRANGPILTATCAPRGTYNIRSADALHRMGLLERYTVEGEPLTTYDGRVIRNVSSYYRIG